jgi:hypothetical protein
MTDPTPIDDAPDAESDVSAAEPKPRASGLSGLGPSESAEHLRERVYGTVSVLAALATLLYSEHHGAGDAILSVAITTGSLWAASLFADITGHLAGHQKPPSRRETLALLSSRSQILACATAPIGLLAAAAFGWWHLHTALIWSAWTQVLTLGVVGLLAVRGTALSFFSKVLVVTAEVGLGLVVVGIKFLSH